MQTLRDVIDHHAESNPDAPFLLAPESGKTLSYRDLRDAARSLAAMLAGEGVAPGEVVSFMLPNGASAATLFLSAMYAGYVVSPLNLVAQDAHLEFSLAHSDTRWVFCALEFVARIERLLPKSGRRVRVQANDPDELALGSATNVESMPPSAASPALLMYTS